MPGMTTIAFVLAAVGVTEDANAWRGKNDSAKERANSRDINFAVFFIIIPTFYSYFDFTFLQNATKSNPNVAPNIVDTDRNKKNRDVIPKSDGCPNSKSVMEKMLIANPTDKKTA